SGYPRGLLSLRGRLLACLVSSCLACSGDRWMSRVTYPAWPNYLSVAIYAAMSAASDRDRAIFGIFGCGSSKNKAILPASKSGILAIVANGGAWSVAARRWVGGKSRTIAEPTVDHCWARRQTPTSPQRPRQVPAP